MTWGQGGEDHPHLNPLPSRERNVREKVVSLVVKADVRKTRVSLVAKGDIRRVRADLCSEGLQGATQLPDIT